MFHKVLKEMNELTLPWKSAGGTFLKMWDLMNFALLS
jgi:hypothetical protein